MRTEWTKEEFQNNFLRCKLRGQNQSEEEEEEEEEDDDDE